MTNNNSQDSPSLPTEWGNSPVLRLTRFYTLLLKKKIGTEPTINYGLVGKTFKSLLSSSKEIQIAVLLMAHLNYNSIKDSNGWMRNKLESSAYPLNLFVNNINVYKQYLIHEKQVEYDDVDTVRNVVYNYIDKL
jgi:hypothetical protein